MATPAAAIMERFADRTGLTAGRTTRRYLWTDAFAVCNFLGLASSGDLADGGKLALRLVDAVHHVLGRHRSDDARRGWISGLDDEAGKAHPTAGGLRIGKPQPERVADAAADPRAEWDQDGQYFHYLTRWMHALDQTGRITGHGVYNAWARELAATALRAFSYQPTAVATRRMYWKMSIDLSRPLVPAMGHHDPLDGYLTCLQLQMGAASSRGGNTDAAPGLDEEVQALADMVAGGDWATTDPLGLGSLMIDAYRLFQIERQHPAAPPEVLVSLLSDVSRALEQALAQMPWQGSARRRLAFRELGLAIGLQALSRLQDRLPMSAQRNLAKLLGPLTEHAAAGEQITGFWLDADNQRAAAWTDHQDINEVMLATALAPSGYLELREVDHGNA